MQPKDVFRGCLSAYAAGLTPHVVLIAGMAAPEGAMSVFAIAILIAFVGALVALPFAGLAIAIHAALKVRGTRVTWWLVILLVTAFALIALSYLIIQAPDPMTLVGYAVIMGVLTGAGFWLGAVGWQWSAVPVSTRIEHHAFRDRSLS